MSLRWNGHGSINVELVHVRRELLFMLQGDGNHWRPAGAEDLGWRAAWPPWVASHWLHSLAAVDASACSCQASPQGSLFTAKQSADINSVNMCCPWPFPSSWMRSMLLFVWDSVPLGGAIVLQHHILETKGWAVDWFRLCFCHCQLWRTAGLENPF